MVNTQLFQQLVHLPDVVQWQKCPVIIIQLIMAKGEHQMYWYKKLNTGMELYFKHAINTYLIAITRGNPKKGIFTKLRARS